MSRQWPILVLLLGVSANGNCSDVESSSATTPYESTNVVPVRLDTVVEIANDAFFRIEDVVLTRERIVALNSGSREVIILDRTGKIIERIGRLGDGPGEFRALTDATFHGDSLLVLDALLRRVQLFTNGDVVTTWLLTDIEGTPDKLGVRDDGRVAVAARVGNRDPSRARGLGVLRDSIKLFLLPTVPGGSPAPLSELTVAGREFFLGRRDDGNEYFATPGFWTDAYYEIGPDGLILADGRSGWAGLITWSGDSTTFLPKPSEQQMVSQDEIDMYLERVHERAARLPNPDAIRSAGFAGLAVWGDVVPRPVLEGILTDGVHLHALEPYAFGTPDTLTWTIMTAQTGRSRLELSSNIRLIAASGHELAAVGRDSLDVESILLLRLRDKQTTRF